MACAFPLTTLGYSLDAMNNNAQASCADSPVPIGYATTASSSSIVVQPILKGHKASDESYRHGTSSLLLRSDDHIHAKTHAARHRSASGARAAVLEPFGACEQNTLRLQEENRHAPSRNRSV